jgi:hypothetical protein
VSEEKRRPVLVYLNEEERAALQARADREQRTLSAMGRLLWLPHILTPTEPRFEDPVEAARRASAS